MLSILSASKTMEVTTDFDLETSSPYFEKEYRAIVKNLQKKSKKSLQALMKISDKITEGVYQNLQTFPASFTAKDCAPAALLYKGEVYTGLKADTFDVEDWSFATDHLRMLSGLYGVLRPLDLVYPYRLEMGLSLKTGSHTNLYKFWDKKIAGHLKETLQSHEVKILLNLASGEYVKSVNEKILGYPLVHVDFREEKNGKLTSNGFTNKRMRGVMAKYVVNTKADHPDELKTFEEEGFRYSKVHSKENHFVFVK